MGWGGGGENTQKTILGFEHPVNAQGHVQGEQEGGGGGEEGGKKNNNKKKNYNIKKK